MEHLHQYLQTQATSVPAESTHRASILPMEAQWSTGDPPFPVTSPTPPQTPKMCLQERAKVKLRENKFLNLRDAPKKPKSVFALFAERHKKEVKPGKGAGKGTSALKDKFSQATEDEKKELERRKRELEDKYHEEVKSFKDHRAGMPKAASEVVPSNHVAISILSSSSSYPSPTTHCFHVSSSVSSSHLRGLAG